MMAYLSAAGSRLDTLFRPQGKVFYGWWIVLSASGIQWLAAVLWMQSYGAYVVLLQEEFGWSKTLLAGAFALTRLESGLLGPLQGWLVDRFGPRIILVIGTSIFGIGFMLFSYVDSILTFYLAFALIALGSSLGGFVTLMVAVVNWFRQHRTKATAVSQIGYSVGGLCVPLVIISLETIGWRATAFYSGILVLIVGLPLIRVIRHRPEDYGELPDGILLPDDDSELAGRLPRGRDYSWREAVRTPAFWLISCGHALSLLVVSTVIVHLIPHLSGGLGYGLATAGSVVALMTACQFSGQFIGGYLGDRFDKRLICVACMIAHSLGLFILAYASSAALVIAFALLHGFAWGIRGPQMVSLRADYFGARSFGTIMGISALVVMFGMMGGPLISGFLADSHGDYEIAFTVIAAAALCGSGCFWAAKPPH